MCVAVESHLRRTYVVSASRVRRMLVSSRSRLSYRRRPDECQTGRTGRKSVDAFPCLEVEHGTRGVGQHCWASLPAPLLWERIVRAANDHFVLFPKPSPVGGRRIWSLMRLAHQAQLDEGKRATGSRLFWRRGKALTLPSLCDGSLPLM